MYWRFGAVQWKIRGRNNHLSHALTAKGFDDRILLLGPSRSPRLIAVQEFGSQLDLAMLPFLPTPSAAKAGRRGREEVVGGETIGSIGRPQDERQP
jgi:hypothetical protein